MKNYFLKLAVLFFVLGAFAGCTSDDADDNAPVVPAPEKGDSLRFLIINEGNFTKGNTSLSAVWSNDTIYNDLFRSANAQRPLGDAAQSLNIIGENIYVALNNSNKIEVMNKTDYKSVHTILFHSNVSPLYITALDNDRAAVSGYSDKLMIINTKTYQVVDSVELGSSSKQMAVVNKRLFIASAGLKMVPLNNLKDVTSIEEIYPIGDSKLIVDKNGNLWTISAGELVCIDPVTLLVKKKIALNGVQVNTFGARLDMNKAKDKLYFNTDVPQGGIFEVSIDAQTTPTTPIFIYTGVEYLYNMNISPDNTIVICDALDFTQRGKIFEYSLTGDLLHTFTAGVIPQYLYFVK